MAGKYLEHLNHNHMNHSSTALHKTHQLEPQDHQHSHRGSHKQVEKPELGMEDGTHYSWTHKALQSDRHQGHCNLDSCMDPDILKLSWDELVTLGSSDHVVDMDLRISVF